MNDHRHIAHPALYSMHASHDVRSGRHYASARNQAAVHHAEPVPTYRLLYNQSKGLYRLYSCAEGQAAPAVPGYIEIEQYTSKEDLKKTLRHWPDLFCFIVYENEQSGDVMFDRCSNIPSHWIDDNLFTSFVLFNNEDDAISYAAHQEIP